MATSGCRNRAVQPSTLRSVDAQIGVSKSGHRLPTFPTDEFVRDFISVHSRQHSREHPLSRIDSQPVPGDDSLVDPAINQVARGVVRYFEQFFAEQRVTEFPSASVAGRKWVRCVERPLQNRHFARQVL